MLLSKLLIIEEKLSIELFIRFGLNLRPSLSILDRII
jgi:hypothetical protein